MVKRHIQLAQEQNQGLDVGLKDICDGSRYKKLLPDRCDTDRVLNLTFTMNTGTFSCIERFLHAYLNPVL